MMEFVLPNGHKLYTKDYIRGVIKAPFACRKVTLIDEGEQFLIDEYLPGLFSPEECLGWLNGVPPEA